MGRERASSKTSEDEMTNEDVKKRLTAALNNLRIKQKETTARLTGQVTTVHNKNLQLRRKIEVLKSNEINPNLTTWKDLAILKNVVFSNRQMLRGK